MHSEQHSEQRTDGHGGRPRLVDIARAAGVSVATVSKVLNGRPDVAARTRSEVEALLEEQGYARTRRKGAGATLEVVFHQLDSEWAIEIIRGVEKVARAEGCSVILTVSGDRHSPGPDWIAGVLQRHPLGVILMFSDLTPENKRKLRSRGVNFVVVDPAGEPDPDVASIGSANWAGGLAAARHLLRLGHRRIGVIGGPGDMLCSRARVDGFRFALEQHGLELEPAMVRDGDFHVSGGLEGGASLLAGPEPPTAIFAGSDLQALGVYRAARALGLSVPADLSVVGYDDLQLAQWAGPPLTTIRQPLTDMAETAARLLLSLADDPTQSPTQRIDLGTSLVVRDSTAPPRRRAVTATTDDSRTTAA